MNTLSQNWLWILIGLGALLFLFRGGHRGFGGFGHGGFGLGGHGHGGHDRGGHGYGGGEGEVRQGYAPSAGPPESAIDPVSGAAVRMADALTSVHQGRIYYFASKENRDRFEASPQEFAAKATGYRIEQETGQRRPHHRRRGC